MSGSSAGFLHMLFTVNVTRPQVCPLDTQAHTQIRREKKRPERRKPWSDPSANNIPECQISWIGAPTFWHAPLVGLRTGIKFSCWVCLYVFVWVHVNFLIYITSLIPSWHQTTQWRPHTTYHISPSMTKVLKFLFNTQKHPNITHLRSGCASGDVWR